MIVFLYMRKTSRIEVGGSKQEGFRADMEDEETDIEEFKIFIDIINMVIG